MKNKILFGLVLFIYLFLPIIILLIPSLFKYKFVILTIVGIIFYILFRILHIERKELGISKDNIISSIKRNLSLIIIGILIILVIMGMGLNKFVPNENIWFYPFYILISVPIQEFLYRGAFGYFDKYIIKNKIVAILLSSFCYSFVHIIYHDILTCILTFIIGIIWYIIYNKDKNLMGVISSHIVLGILTIVLGIVD